MVAKFLSTKAINDWVYRIVNKVGAEKELVSRSLIVGHVVDEVFVVKTTEHENQVRCIADDERHGHREHQQRGAARAGLS